MNTVLRLSVFLALFLVCGGLSGAQTIVPVRLKDVRTIYVDDKSFKFAFSSCGTQAGNLILPCPQHGTERLKFLDALKRWLSKSGFTIVDNRSEAEGIVQGRLSIDEIGWPDELKRQEKHPTYNPYEPQWNVEAWLVNQDGRRLWTKEGVYPDISYTGGQAKVEGKKLAKAIEYDAKHAR